MVDRIEHASHTRFRRHAGVAAVCVALTAGFITVTTSYADTNLPADLRAVQSAASESNKTIGKRLERHASSSIPSGELACATWNPNPAARKPFRILLLSRRSTARAKSIATRAGVQKKTTVRVVPKDQSATARAQTVSEHPK
ncbi:MAG: hypothetical protein WAP35_00810 [Solirubrobacterales bacterium]